MALWVNNRALGEASSGANTPLAHSADDQSGVRNQAANPTSVHLRRSQATRRHQGLRSSPLREPLRSRFYVEGELGRIGDVKES
jgi:hypothetical protein